MLIHYPGLSKNPILCPFRKPSNNARNYGYRTLVSYGVLPMDAFAFREWARLMYKRSDAISDDAMIAATAIVHRLTVATRNVRDFERLGVEFENPFESR